jgi:transcriptional regulator with XRE-family HTH domain
MNYSKAIKIVRATKNLSQKELGLLLNMDPSFISLIESGKRKPSLDTIETITTKLDIPYYLFALLASEDKDLSKIGSKEAQELGRGLIDVLISNKSN